MRTNVASFSSLTWVLCVGVDDPGDAGLSKLTTAESDATALADALTNSGGCAVPSNQVRCLTGHAATRDSILTVLQEIIASTGDQQAAILYFAGHAVDRDGEFFFCPSGLNLLRPGETAVRATDIDDCIRSSKARGVLLILDCCQSAGFAENAPQSFRSLGAGEYRIVLAASRVNQRSWEFKNGSGTLFSRNLIDIVSGKLIAGSSAGMVYFSDLLRTIQEQMEEQRESLGPDLPPQQPVFTGVYTQDPLLFVQRELTLEQIKLNTARYSPAYVRRQIRNWVLAIAALLYVAGTIYYGLLKNSEYATTSGDKIAIYRGYPGFGAPGYPVHLWTLSYGAERLKNRPALHTQLTWIAPLGKPVLPLLDSDTRADFLAARAAQEGRPDEARRQALDILDHPGSHSEEEMLYGALVFSTVARTGDIPRLHALLQSQRSEVRLAAARQLATIEPGYIFPIAQQDLPAGTSFPHDDFVRQVRGPCTPQLEHYLEALLSIESNVPTTQQVLNTALRTGCELSVPALVKGVLRPQLWGETDAAWFAALRKEDTALADSLFRTLHTSGLDDVRRQTVIGTLAALPNPPCLRELVGHLQSGPWWVQLEEAFALSRGCADYSFSMAWVFQSHELEFRLAENGAVVWEIRLDSRKSDYRNAFHFLVKVAETDQHPDVRDTLAGIVGDIDDDYIRARVLFALDSPGFQGKINEDLLRANNLEVRRATYELMRRRNAHDLAARLLPMIGGADEFYKELVGRTPLSPEQLQMLRTHLNGSADEQRQSACILAMQDAPVQVLELLTSPDAEIRQSASNCAAYNDHADTILQKLKSLKSAFPLESIADLEVNLELRDSLRAELEKLDPRFRQWRLKLIDDQPFGLLPESLRYWVREQLFQTRGPTKG